MSEEPKEEKTDLIAQAKTLPPTEVFSLKPRTFEEAFRFANLIATSTLIPKEFQSSPANVLIAVQLGMELGVAPMQALQNIAVVNGRPVIWGDLVPAIVYQSGLCEQFDEQGDAKRATCTVKRKGFPPITRSFSMDEAKLAGLADRQTYKQYPARMLQMRARGYAVRDAFPDVLKGVHLREELEDTEARDVTPLKVPQAITEKKEDESKRTPTENSVDSSPTKRSKRPNSGATMAASVSSEHIAEVEKPTSQASGEKSQEDIINELILWVESAPAEELLKEKGNFLLDIDTGAIKQLHGTPNQLKVLKPYNDRKQALAKVQ